MELEEIEVKSLKWLPMESRNILVDFLKWVKVKKTEEINKMISNNDMITYRNWLIAFANFLIWAMQTEQPNKQDATLLTRQSIKELKNMPLRLQTKTKK